jgi:hypothetical protein
VLELFPAHNSVYLNHVCLLMLYPTDNNWASFELLVDSEKEGPDLNQSINGAEYIFPAKIS